MSTNLSFDPLVSPQRRKLIAAGIAVPSLLLPLASANAAEDERGIVGSQAPELDVESWIDAEGKPAQFSLLAQRGKWIYLKCWQSWCPGCHSHGFPNLQKVTNAFIDDDRVVTVAIQTVFEGHEVNTGDKVRETQQRYELPIFMGHDPGKSTDSGYPNTMISYRTGGTPWQVLISPAGTVVFDGFQVNADKLISVLKQELEAGEGQG